MKGIKIEKVDAISWCPQIRLSKKIIPLEVCKECPFHGGIDGEEVKCYQLELPKLNTVHVNGFRSGNNLYLSRMYDEKRDGKITGDDPYDYCQKCDMCVNLNENGDRFCILRMSVKDEASPFICYEGEIWKKYQEK